MTEIVSRSHKHVGQSSGKSVCYGSQYCAKGRANEKTVVFDADRPDGNHVHFCVSSNRFELVSACLQSGTFALQALVLQVTRHTAVAILQQPAEKPPVEPRHHTA